MKRTLATTLAAAAPLSALLWLSGALPAHLALGAVTLVVFFVTLSGFLALRALDLADLPAPAAWVAGVFASSLAVYALVAWFKLFAATAFAVWATVVVACAIVLRERGASPRRLDWREVRGVALCALAAAPLCRRAAAAPAGGRGGGGLSAPAAIFVLVAGAFSFCLAPPPPRCR